METDRQLINRLLSELEILRRALDQIDRHRVGACEHYSTFPEPCEECGEMRDIAAQALAAIGKARE